MMRILLQQKATGLYLQEFRTWTRDPAEAMDFLSSTRAIEFCVAHRIVDAQLVLKFEEEHYDIVLPMLVERGSSATSRLHR